MMGRPASVGGIVRRLVPTWGPSATEPRNVGAFGLFYPSEPALHPQERSWVHLFTVRYSSVPGTACLLCRWVDVHSVFLRTEAAPAGPAVGRRRPVERPVTETAVRNLAYGAGCTRTRRTGPGRRGRLPSVTAAAAASIPTGRTTGRAAGRATRVSAARVPPVAASVMSPLLMSPVLTAVRGLTGTVPGPPASGRRLNPRRRPPAGRPPRPAPAPRGPATGYRHHDAQSDQQTHQEQRNQ